VIALGTVALLFGVGAVGGALNSVAGGGSFLVFPTMLFAGVPPVMANATTAVALWPASVASAVAYRNELPRERRTMIVLSLASALGGFGGARVLLATSDETFTRILPWLLLLATTVFTFGPRATRREQKRPLHVPLAAGAVVQLAIAAYGGYFGGGMGILMLATFTLMGMTNMHPMNALKAVLGSVINGLANVAFVLAKKVAWSVAAPVLVGSVVGGFFGAAYARRVNPKKVRACVLVFAWSLTAFFFVKTYR